MIVVAVPAALILITAWAAAMLCLGARYPRHFPAAGRTAAAIIPATGQHARPLELTWDELAGRYRHAETGPMELPQQYYGYAGKAAEGWWAS